MEERQYVVFKLGDESYGVDIVNVKEICEFREAVKVPNVPSFVNGVINLRGEIVPIVDLGKRFNIYGDFSKDQSRIIIIHSEDKLIGFSVDEASQVIMLNESDIEAAPGIVVGGDKKYISGIGKNKEELIILLNLEHVLSDLELKQIQGM